MSPMLLFSFVMAQRTNLSIKMEFCTKPRLRPGDPSPPRIPYSVCPTALATGIEARLFSCPVTKVLVEYTECKWHSGQSALIQAESEDALELVGRV